MACSAEREKLELLENILKAVDPRDLGVAFHNAFSHGENLTAHGIPFSDDELEELFTHLEGITTILSKL
jgi:hypothetical protein